jgi:hypothetical protein
LSSAGKSVAAAVSSAVESAINKLDEEKGYGILAKIGTSNTQE